MNKSYKPYINDVGTVLLINTGIDITNATVTKILVKKPFDKIEEWEGTKHIDNKSIKFTSLDHGENAYQELGMNIVGSEESGLIPNNNYNITINGDEYIFYTGNITTYNQIISDLNTYLSGIDISVSLVSGDIRFTHNINSYKNNVILSLSSQYCLFKALTGFTKFNDPVNAIVSSFDRPGVYNLQSYVELPEGKFRGATVELEIFDNFR